MSYIKKFNRLLKTKPVLCYLLFTFCLSLIVNFGILKTYAYRDIYEYFWTAKYQVNFEHEFIKGGRFILGAIIKFVFGSLVHSFSDLKWIRLFSLICSVLFSTQLFRFFLKLNFKIYESAIFSFLVLSIPSFTIYMGWTATFQIPLLLSLSFHAGILLLNSFTQNKNYVSNTIIALVLILFCLCIYQPAATAFLIPITIFTISKKKLLVKHCFYLVAFLFTSLIVYYIIFQLSLKWYNVMPADRTALSLFKIPYKLILFYLRELRMLMYGSGILVLKKLTLITGIISFLGFFYLLIVKKQHRYKNLKFFLFFSLVLAFSYTPNILSSSYYVCSRVIAPAAIIVLFYQFYFFRHLILKKKLNKKIGVFIALLFIILSSINQNIFISKIQQTEFLAIKERVNQISLENKKDIVIIKPEDSFLIKNEFYKNNYADEFGQVSSSRIWVAKPMFQQLLAERKNETPLKLNYKISTINEEINKPVKDSIIIDLRYVLKNAFK